MNKPVLTLVVVLAALGVWQFLSPRGPLSLAQGVADGFGGGASAHSAAGSAPASGAAGSSALEGGMPSGAASAGAFGTPVAVTHPPIESYRLTRVLAGDQAINFESREQRLLGTREVNDEQGRQTLLVVRDEMSGALSYWQSGLRFALKPGIDYESYLREHITLRRQFVNTDYADAAVDAADIAAAYRSLSSDPRVAGVRLLPLVKRNKLK